MNPLTRLLIMDNIESLYLAAYVLGCCHNVDYLMNTAKKQFSFITLLEVLYGGCIVFMGGICWVFMAFPVLMLLIADKSGLIDSWSTLELSSYSGFYLSFGIYLFLIASNGMKMMKKIQFTDLKLNRKRDGSEE